MAATPIDMPMVLGQLVPNADHGPACQSGKTYAQVAAAWRDQGTPIPDESTCQATWDAMVAADPRLGMTGDARRAANEAATKQMARAWLGVPANDDPRLADARPPLPHAHSASDVSGCVADTDPRLSDPRPPTNHNHDAAEINSGVLAPARIASGTPDGTRFACGDGTWKAPPGGGGITRATKTLDQALTSATPTNVTDLSFAVSAGVAYYFRFAVIFRSPTATVGIQLGLTFPAATVFSARACIPIAADGAGCEIQGALTSSGDMVIGTAVPVINTDYTAIVDGVIVPTANGTLQLRAATETGVGPVTVRQGSCGLLM